MASKKKVGARVKVSMSCSECKRKNYTTVKNKKNTADKIEMKKYCPYDRKHTLHKEGKV
jgi:large subunit ribosomal protein L33